MRVWFAGSETATYRKFLIEEGVDRWAINLAPYFSQRQAIKLRDDFEGKQVLLYSSSPVDQDKLVRFLDANDANIAHVVAIAGAEGHDRYVPRWLGDDILDLEAEMSRRAVVSVDETMSDDMRRQIAALAYRGGSSELMIVSSRSNVLMSAPWDHALVAGWLESRRFHELQVWSHDHVHRFSRENRMEAVGRLQADIAALGIDPADLAADASEMDVRLAIRSWKRWEDQGGRRRGSLVAIQGGKRDGVDTDSRHPSIATDVRSPRHERSVKVTLPVLRTEIEGDSEVVRSTTGMIRECDTCNIQRSCPEFQPEHLCAFEIPVRITTKNELLAVLTSFLEMQAHRVFFARFAEDLLGQGIDPVVSAELERFMRMSAVFRDFVDNREYLKIGIEARANGGVLSRLFGSDVGAANTTLPMPVSIEALEEAILDAELVDPTR